MAANGTPELERVPQHVAIIMDGNGRWAQQRGLPRIAGHRAGTNNIRQILEGCVEAGVRYLTIYAFSTENWQRPQQEVFGLMRILEDVIQRELNELHRQGVCLRHLGWLDGVDESLSQQVLRAVELTQNNTRLFLNIAFNYGGRAEIIAAIKAIIRDGVPAEDIDTDTVSKYLFTHGQPDPDFIIRTGGELRLSNYLLWQAAYAEIYMTPTYWPDFGKADLFIALQDYARRDRRFGRVNASG
ncbi:MAG: di-trans,poly-cis-decaprenylcistransferase [Chloroflexi bacterium]|nr:di-trans,poly-cis-decaprenylcistransferase [Chloroflexota bacterium]